MSETTRNEKCTDCEHAGTCSSAGFDLTCATGKWARRGAPQRTEETMPQEILDALQEYRSTLCTVFYDTTPMATAERLESEAIHALGAAILRALRSPADRIAELEARVGTLSVALEMARSPASARCACTQEAGDSPCPVHGMDEEDLYIIDPAPASPPPVAREARPTMTELDELQRLCDEAFPGPWTAEDQSMPEEFVWWNVLDTEAAPVAEAVPDADTARFIAAARTWLPRLVSLARESAKESK